MRTSAARAPRERPGPLLHAKLMRPELGPDTIERPSLLGALLDHARCSLTLLVADAGYGKTTLLAASARRQRRPLVWYSLMPSDADPVVFTRHALAGFRRLAPRFGRHLSRLLSEPRAAGASPEVLAGTLANELSALKGPPVLFVLDDFHEVEHCAPVAAIVDGLLRFLPPTVRLAIASRALPPLPLDRLRARGELFELDSDELRFGREELARLFESDTREPLADEDLDALERATQGWPTAARLLRDAWIRRRTTPLRELVDELGHAPLEVRSYVSSEVLGRLDPADRRLLERAAPLPRIDETLAQAVAGIADAGERLDRLARRGLLRALGTTQPRSYEFHDLVRQAVRSDILERDGDSGWRALERGAADALRARGETELALGYYLAAGAHDEAATLLSQVAPRLLREGRAPTLLRFLGELPEDVVERDGALVLARADAAQAVGQWDEAETLYGRVLERSRAEGDRERECRALLGLGKVLNFRGRHEHVLGMAERGLAAVEGLSLPVRVRLLQMKASAHYYLGQYRAAVALLDQVRGLLPAAADPELLVPTIHNRAVALAALGRFVEAAREFRAALAQVRGASPRAPLYLANLATALVEVGELAEARRSAEEGLQAAQRYSNRAQEVGCWAALAEALVDMRDFDGALAALKRAEELNSGLRIELIAADLLALRGRVFCGRGQYRRAAELLGRAIERLADRRDAPRLPDFRATLAWCELRSGRAHTARQLLAQLVKAADAGENDHHRMRVHYWMAEALLARHEERAAEPHLTRALALVREHDYRHFLSQQAREDPAPLLHALANGLEVDLCAGALTAAGPEVEAPLLGLLDDARVRVAEAAIAVLAEIGGPLTLEQLPAIVASRRTLQAAARVALRHVAERGRRSEPAPAAEAGPAPRLVLFGPPRLELGGAPMSASAWRSQRAFQLVAYLALHPRGTSRDQLLEMFWPGRQMAAGRRNFHPTLSYARHVLPRNEAVPLLREAEVYRLNPDYPLRCDVWEFDGLLEAARRERDPAERRAKLEAAAALAQRPLLEGWYGNWADELQGRTRDRVETLSLELGQLCEEQGDLEPALACYRRAAELDAFRETTRVAVIRCLVALGNQRAAVVEHEKLKGLLSSELGTDPLPETEEAVESLLQTASAPAGGRATSRQIDGQQEVVAASQVPLKPLGGHSRA